MMGSAIQVPKLHIFQWLGRCGEAELGGVKAKCVGGISKITAETSGILKAWCGESSGGRSLSSPWSYKPKNFRFEVEGDSGQK